MVSSLDITIACPLVHEQRWFTEYEALNWFVKHQEKIKEGYEKLPDFMPGGESPVTEDWVLLEQAIKPLAEFCWTVEGNVFPLSESYTCYNELRNELVSLRESNKFIYPILDEMDKR